MTFYFVVHNPLGDYAMTFKGMDEITVQGLLGETGFPFESIDQAAYDGFLEANRPLESVVTTPVLTENQLVLQDPNATTDEKVDALIKYLGLN